MASTGCSNCAFPLSSQVTHPPVQSATLRRELYDLLLYIQFPHLKIQFWSPRITIPTSENTILTSENTILKPQNTILKPQNTILKPQNTILKPQNTILTSENTILKSEYNSHISWLKYFSNIPWTSSRTLDDGCGICSFSDTSCATQPSVPMFSLLLQLKYFSDIPWMSGWLRMSDSMWWPWCFFIIGQLAPNSAECSNALPCYERFGPVEYS